MTSFQSNATSFVTVALNITTLQCSYPETLQWLGISYITEHYCMSLGQSCAYFMVLPLWWNLANPICSSISVSKDCRHDSLSQVLAVQTWRLELNPQSIHEKGDTQGLLCPTCACVHIDTQVGAHILAGGEKSFDNTLHSSVENICLL